MPAVSQAQQRFFAICEHTPTHARGTCPNLPKATLREFAATPRTGLPVHVKAPTILDALTARRPAR